MDILTNFTMKFIQSIIVAIVVAAFASAAPAAEPATAAATCAGYMGHCALPRHCCQDQFLTCEQGRCIYYQ
ncbi:hypothetical protein BGW42_003618 [Actinomortierella wolfii]|nr:hypothetical protein BGW42_003618 [Actinomortierella wolfii]